MTEEVRVKKLNHLATNILIRSVILLAVSCIWSYRVGLTGNEVAHRLYHATENLKGLRANVVRMQEKLK